jgi:hypothetical protein
MNPNDEYSPNLVNLVKSSMLWPVNGLDRTMIKQRRSGQVFTQMHRKVLKNVITKLFPLSDLEIGARKISTVAMFAALVAGGHSWP